MEVAVITIMDGLRGVFVAKGSVSPVAGGSKGGKGDPERRKEGKWSGEVGRAESWKVGGGRGPREES
jgi:hypothetical protein